MDKQLKMLAGAIVVKSKLSKSAKEQLLNFIQHEATDIQIKALLLDGKIATTLDEQAEDVITDRFKSYIVGKDLVKKLKEILSIIKNTSKE